MTLSFCRNILLEIKVVLNKTAEMPEYIRAKWTVLMFKKSVIKNDGIKSKRNAVINIMKLTATNLRLISIPMPVRLMALKQVMGKIPSNVAQIRGSGT